jgi:hypothetical protein
MHDSRRLWARRFAWVWVCMLLIVYYLWAAGLECGAPIAWSHGIISLGVDIYLRCLARQISGVGGNTNCPARCGRSGRERLVSDGH